MNLVGRFLEEGWVGPPDPVAAAAWYRRAAEGGDFRGQHNLAMLLAESGDTESAASWFRRAGEAGSLDFRRVAADQLLRHPVPAIRHEGLVIAQRCCRDGGGEDYHRYGRALGEDGHLKLAQAWLRMAMAAGCAAASDDLTRLTTSTDLTARTASRWRW